VYHDAMLRYAHSQQISEKLLERSFKVITREIDTAQAGIGNATALVVFNPLSWTRTEVATKTLYVPVEADGRLQNYVVKDSAGKVIPSQIRHQRIREHFQPGFWEKRYPSGQRIREFDLSFVAADVPSCGYKTYYLCSEGATPISRIPPREYPNLKVTESGMENSYLKVEINPNGTINLTDKLSGLSLSGLHFFEDVESVCGEYHHYTAPNSQVITSLSEHARISVVESGPLCATFKIELEMLLPESATDDVQGRSDKLVRCPITTDVTLAAKSRRLDFKTIIENNAKDHRLRVRFPTKIHSRHVYAEGQFEVIKRNIELPEAEGWVEKPVVENPHQTFVSVSDGQYGLSLVNRGLPEYAAEETEDGMTLSLTLLRSVGWIGREHFVTATYKLPTPDAQCLGRGEFEYSLYPHNGDWEKSKAWQAAHNFNAPLEMVETGLHSGRLEPALSLISLEPPELVVSAIKGAEGEDGLIVRLYNISDRPVQGKLKAFTPIKKAIMTNLLEELIAEIEVDEGQIQFPVNPHQIVTLKLYF
jgi:alpha-mannosidase